MLPSDGGHPCPQPAGVPRPTAFGAAGQDARRMRAGSPPSSYSANIFFTRLVTFDRPLAMSS
jgi:hypothetical protein